MQTNILEYLEATAPRLPDKIAYSNGTEHLTFLELYHASRAIGSGLLAHGIRRAPVAILMQKHPKEIAAFYGAVYAGCYYIPIDPEMPASRMDVILENVGARTLIVDDKGQKLAQKLNFSGEVLSYETLAATEISDEALAKVRASQIDTDPIYIVFTSGSTGVPKGVVACHRSVIDYTETLSVALGFSEDNVFANQTPLFFDAPLKELMPVIKFGATAYLVPKKYFLFPMSLCDYLNEHRINTVCWVVSALTMISDMGVLEVNPPKYLKTVAFGSEVFARPKYERWRAALPDASFFNLYGPTEATGMSCYWKAERDLAENEPIPVGHPFRNTEVMLITEEGKEATAGEMGEIYLRGTCVTLGYFNNPEKTREAFVQNPLHQSYPETVYRTGDIGYINPYGELVFVSRRDAQIKHMGHRIELGEIEAAASHCKGICEVGCIYDREAQKICLYYTGKVADGELAAVLRERLPKYMLPAYTEALSAMPHTANGKLDRKTLAARER